MLKKTLGIVINYTKFKETSIVTNIYTEQFGIRTYIENGVRSAKSKNKIALFQPLTLVDMVVFENEKKSIKRISEIKCNHPFQTIPYEIGKSSIALFLAEVLKKCIKEEETNAPLYTFLNDSILYLDSPISDYSNFHLTFLIKLSAFLGFSPETADQVLEEFQALNFRPFSGQLYEQFNQLLQLNFGEKISLNRQQRTDLLDIILSFYKIHVEGFGHLKSNLVLREVLD
jgi:DNA repair protein RecO (recombination protein O)